MSRTVGGHIPGLTLAVVPKSGWTDPEIGNLVIWDTGGPYWVDECAADENPMGQIIAMTPAKDVLTIEQFTPGSVQVLPYTGSPAVGDKIEATGAAVAGEGVVRLDNGTGVGKVVAVARKTGYLDVLF